METSFQITLPNQIYCGMKGNGLNPEYDDAVAAIRDYLHRNRVISQFGAANLLNVMHEDAYAFLMSLSLQGILSYTIVDERDFIFYLP